MAAPLRGLATRRPPQAFEGGIHDENTERFEFEEDEGSEEEISSEQALQQLKDQEEVLASTILHGRAAFEPNYLPIKYGYPAAVIHLRSYYASLIQLFSHFVAHSGTGLGIPLSPPTPLPKQRTLWTVPKGPFVHKKSQENFDRITHKRVIKAWDADPEVIEKWVRYLEAHAMAGVGMRVVRWERAPVGVGKIVERSVKQEMKKSSKEKIVALSEKILKQELASAKKQPTDKASTPALAQAKAEARPPAEAKEPEAAMTA